MVLVGYWPLNESSGTTAYDHSGKENHGTINDGGDSTVPGATGVLSQNAYSFDGTNDYVDTQNSFSNPKFTATAWFNVDSLVDDYRAILADHSNNEGFAIQYYPDSYNNEFGAHFGTGSGWTKPVSGVAPEAGSWYFLSLSYDGTKGRLYVNGKMTNEISTSYQTSSTNVFIGDSSGYDQSITGRISEVRVYNHALTALEIQYLYQVGKRGRQVTSSKIS